MARRTSFASGRPSSGRGSLDRAARRAYRKPTSRSSSAKLPSDATGRPLTRSRTASTHAARWTARVRRVSRPPHEFERSPPVTAHRTTPSTGRSRDDSAPESRAPRRAHRRSTWRRAAGGSLPRSGAALRCPAGRRPATPASSLGGAGRRADGTSSRRPALRADRSAPPVGRASGAESLGRCSTAKLRYSTGADRARQRPRRGNDELARCGPDRSGTDEIRLLDHAALELEVDDPSLRARLRAPSDRVTLVPSCPSSRRSSSGSDPAAAGTVCSRAPIAVRCRPRALGDVGFSMIVPFIRKGTRALSQLHVGVDLRRPGSIRRSEDDGVTRLPYDRQIGNGTVDLEWGWTYRGEILGSLLLGRSGARASPGRYATGSSTARARASRASALGRCRGAPGVESRPRCAWRLGEAERNRRIRPGTGSARSILRTRARRSARRDSRCRSRPA